MNNMQDWKQEIQALSDDELNNMIAIYDGLPETVCYADELKKEANYRKSHKRIDNSDGQLSAETPLVKKDWNEFRDTGLFRFINAFLHIFGWCIVIEMEDGKITSVYPAKTIYRGFSEESMSKSYKQVAELMAKDHEEIMKFAKE